MKVSELIERLQALRTEHGDIEIGYTDNEFFDTCEITNVSVLSRDLVKNVAWRSDPDSLGDIWIEIGSP